jgi:IPT/TIG domain
MNASMPTVLLAAGSHNPAISDGSKAGAILIGIAFLLVLYGVTALITRHWRLRDLLNGFDGFGSSSKLQWFLWLIAILFGYVAIWVLRAEQGNYSALTEIPVNLLTVLGFSTGTAAAAKGITAGYVQTGKVAKTGVSANPTPATTGGIFQDDSGGPELAKIQMIGFTIIAIGIFLATVIHQIVTGDIKDSLPNIDSSLMVLMGISQGGYLGKKLVTFGTPVLYPPDPISGPAGTAITLNGSGLGAQKGNSQLMLNGAPIPTTDWADAVVHFTVPAEDPATGVAWANPPKVVLLAASMTGQVSNTISFKVTA